MTPDSSDPVERTEGGGDAPAREPEVVPKLPRGRGIRLSGPEIFRIITFAAMLVAIVALQRPCSDGVARFVESFSPVDAGPAVVTDPASGMELRRLTDEEIRHYFPGAIDAGAAESPATDPGAAAKPDPGASAEPDLGAAAEPEPAP